MAVTPQTNVTLEEFASHLLEYDQFVLCGHVSPDGDCLGSQLALSAALRELGKQTVCVLAKPEPFERGLEFMPGADELVAARDYEGPVQAFIACDVPNAARMEDGAALHARAQVRFTIDHHAAPESMADYNYVDPDAPAVGLLVWKLIALLGVKRSAAMATCAYMALMTDTGRFQFQNTTPEAFAAAGEMIAAGADPSLCAQEAYQRRSIASMKLEMRALERMVVSDGGGWVLTWLSSRDFQEFGAVKSDAEPLVDVIRSIDGVKVACILRDQVDCIRGSFRSKDDAIDVAQVARELGGGGHKAAAGFTLHCSLEEAVAMLPEKLDTMCAAAIA